MRFVRNWMRIVQMNVCAIRFHVFISFSVLAEEDLCLD